MRQMQHPYPVQLLQRRVRPDGESVSGSIRMPVMFLSFGKLVRHGGNRWDVSAPGVLPCDRPTRRGAMRVGGLSFVLSGFLLPSGFSKAFGRRLWFYLYALVVRLCCNRPCETTPDCLFPKKQSPAWLFGSRGTLWDARLVVRQPRKFVTCFIYLSFFTTSKKLPPKLPHFFPRCPTGGVTPFWWRGGGGGKARQGRDALPPPAVACAVCAPISRAPMSVIISDRNDAQRGRYGPKNSPRRNGRGR